MARPDVLKRLADLGWDGPTSYTLPYLNEMIGLLENGTTVEELKASRKKTSSAEVKGNGRQPKGEWVDCDSPGIEVGQDIMQEFERGGVRYRFAPPAEEGGEITVQKFVPTVKEKPAKGEWVACENPGIEVTDGEVGEYEHEGLKYRTSLVVGSDLESAGLTWERWQPFVKKAAKLKSEQQASFDPREMLRAFENMDMRVRTGGRDWTQLDVTFLESQLQAAQAVGDAAVVVDVDGSAESCDCVWLEALVAVKKRLALREEATTDGSDDVQRNEG